MCAATTAVSTAAEASNCALFHRGSPPRLACLSLVCSLQPTMLPLSQFSADSEQVQPIPASLRAQSSTLDADHAPPGVASHTSPSLPFSGCPPAHPEWIPIHVAAVLPSSSQSRSVVDRVRRSSLTAVDFAAIGIVPASSRVVKARWVCHLPPLRLTLRPVTPAFCLGFDRDHVHAFVGPWCCTRPGPCGGLVMHGGAMRG